MDWGHLFNPEFVNKNDTPENKKCSEALVFFCFYDTQVFLQREIIGRFMQCSAKYIAVCAVN